ncbi:hypothetical protein SAMN05216167_106246 [Spirosoma endophyticum]|uniref:Uncharacterized protein n=1 Tax=Spirosoma endophyticum TaxID=662367 RepID=A0A1I1UEX3_9BACT|nr:hypothetical protein SAMN05216167_106246 [Spirosoma endophyticum]
MGRFFLERPIFLGYIFIGKSGYLLKDHFAGTGLSTAGNVLSKHFN